MTDFKCHFGGCEREARKGYTTCGRHYSAGMSRKQWDMAQKAKSKRKRGNR